jgi:hypothetical protein
MQGELPQKRLSVKVYFQIFSAELCSAVLFCPPDNFTFRPTLPIKRQRSLLGKPWQEGNF